MLTDIGLLLCRQSLFWQSGVVLSDVWTRMDQWTRQKYHATMGFQQTIVRELAWVSNDTC